MDGDAELVRRARRGDRAALDEIYDRYCDDVYTVCVHVLGDPDRAGDAALATFTLAVQGRLSPLSNPNHLGTWLATLARSAALAPYGPVRHPRAMDNDVDPAELLRSAYLVPAPRALRRALARTFDKWAAVFAEGPAYSGPAPYPAPARPIATAAYRSPSRVPADWRARQALSVGAVLVVAVAGVTVALNWPSGGTVSNVGDGPAPGALGPVQVTAAAAASPGGPPAAHLVPTVASEFTQVAVAGNGGISLLAAGGPKVTGAGIVLSPGGPTLLVPSLGGTATRQPRTRPHGGPGGPGVTPGPTVAPAPTVAPPRPTPAPTQAPPPKPVPTTPVPAPTTPVTVPPTVHAPEPSTAPPTVAPPTVAPTTPSVTPVPTVSTTAPAPA